MPRPQSALALSLCLALISPSGAEDAAKQQASFQLNISHEEPQFTASIKQGMECLLLGHSEAAKQHFLDARAQDASNPMANCGLILSCSGVELPSSLQEQYDEALQQLKELDLNSLNLHPQEERYLNSLSLLLSQNYQQAGDSFAQLAQQYRADTGLALWAILLLHDYYDQNGQPSQRQAQALQLAEQILTRDPQNPLANYLRALIEENAPQVSQQALQSIDTALAGLPEQAMPHLLKGHLLYRQAQDTQSTEDLEKSLAQMILAEQKASAWQKGRDLHWRENSVWLRARLYRLTILHQLGQDSEFLQLYASTIRQNLPLSTSTLEQQADCLSQAEMLYYWELKTLPLRMDFGSAKRLSQQALSASIAPHRLFSCDNQQLQTLPTYAKCLATLINAQRYIDQGKIVEAQTALQQGIELKEQLQHEWAELDNYSLTSNILRALEACDIAINMLRIQAFPNTTYIWETSLREVTRLSSMLMPPVIISAATK